MALLALCPLLSALLLEIWHPARDEQEEPDDRPTTWSFPFLPVALLALYKLIFYFSLSLTDGPSLFGPLGIIVISLIALIGTLFFFQSFTPTLLYRLSLPFMVAGLLLLAWLHTGSMAATMLTNASNIGFELFIFLAPGPSVLPLRHRRRLDVLHRAGGLQRRNSLGAPGRRGIHPELSRRLARGQSHRGSRRGGPRHLPQHHEDPHSTPLRETRRPLPRRGPRLGRKRVTEKRRLAPWSSLRF